MSNCRRATKTKMMKNVNLKTGNDDFFVDIFLRRACTNKAHTYFISSSNKYDKINFMNMLSNLSMIMNNAYVINKINIQIMFSDASKQINVSYTHLNQHFQCKYQMDLVSI